MLTTLRELGEERVINKLLVLFKNHMPKYTRLEKDDDVTAIMNDEIALKIDGYSSTKSKYPWEPWWKWGWKAITAVISDLSAKGYLGIGISYSIGAPPTTNYKTIEEIVKGIVKAIKEYKLTFMGGDTNSSEKDIWIDVAGIGRLFAEKPLSRKASIRKPILVLTTLKNGYGVTGLYAYFYKQGKEPPPKLKNYLPKAVTEFPKIITEIEPVFSIDTSDGLAKSLSIIAEKNNYHINITELPIDDTIHRYCIKHDVPIEKTILYGGEEYEVIFGITSEKTMKTLNTCKSLGIQCRIIGTAVPSKKPKVTLNEKIIETSGWDQFKGSTVW